MEKKQNQITIQNKYQQRQRINIQHQKEIRYNFIYNVHDSQQSTICFQNTKYKIGEIFQENQTYQIYECINLQTKQKCLIKILVLQIYTNTIIQFIQTITSNLHKNIVRIIDRQIRNYNHNNFLLIVMPQLYKINLSPLNYEQLLDYCIQFCNCMKYFHKHNIFNLNLSFGSSFMKDKQDDVKFTDIKIMKSINNQKQSRQNDIRNFGEQLKLFIIQNQNYLKYDGKTKTNYEKLINKCINKSETIFANEVVYHLKTIQILNILNGLQPRNYNSISAKFHMITSSQKSVYQILLQKTFRHIGIEQHIEQQFSLSNLFNSNKKIIILYTSVDKDITSNLKNWIAQWQKRESARSYRLIIILNTQFYRQSIPFQQIKQQAHIQIISTKKPKTQFILTIIGTFCKMDQQFYSLNITSTVGKNLKQSIFFKQMEQKIIHKTQSPNDQGEDLQYKLSSNNYYNSQNINNKEMSQKFKQLGYIINKFKGIGSDGQVYQCMNIRQKKKYAIKYIKILKTDEQYDQRKYEILQEIKIIQKLHVKDPQHVIKIYKHHFEQNRFRCIFIIVMELLQKSLLEYFQQLKSKLLFDKIIDFGVKIAQGIQQLHHLKIIHLDICLSNILIDTSQSILKICDFSISKQAQDIDKIKFTYDDIAGHYISPQRSKGYIGYCVDVWGFGVLLFQLISTKQVKFRYAEMIKKQIQNFKKQKKQIQNNGDIYGIIDQCLKEFENRPDISSIKQSLNKLNPKSKLLNSTRSEIKCQKQKQQQQQQQQQQIIEIQCERKFICIQKFCYSIPYFCSRMHCKCFNSHENCRTTDVNQFKQKISKNKKKQEHINIKQLRKSLGQLQYQILRLYKQLDLIEYQIQNFNIKTKQIQKLQKQGKLNGHKIYKYLSHQNKINTYIQNSALIIDQSKSQINKYTIQLKNLVQSITQMNNPLLSSKIISQVNPQNSQSIMNKINSFYSIDQNLLQISQKNYLYNHSFYEQMNKNECYLCYNVNCKQNALICPKQGCQCRIRHEKCNFILINQLNKKIYKRNTKLQNFFQNFEQRFQKKFQYIQEKYFQKINMDKQIQKYFKSIQQQSAYLASLTNQQISQILNHCQSLQDISLNLNKQKSTIKLSIDQKFPTQITYNFILQQIDFFQNQKQMPAEQYYECISQIYSAKTQKDQIKYYKGFRVNNPDDFIYIQQMNDLQNEAVPDVVVMIYLRHYEIIVDFMIKEKIKLVQLAIVKKCKLLLEQLFNIYNFEFQQNLKQQVKKLNYHQIKEKNPDLILFQKEQKIDYIQQTYILKGKVKILDDKTKILDYFKKIFNKLLSLNLNKNKLQSTQLINIKKYLQIQNQSIDLLQSYLIGPFQNTFQNGYIYLSHMISNYKEKKDLIGCVVCSLNRTNQKSIVLQNVIISIDKPFRVKYLQKNIQNIRNYKQNKNRKSQVKKIGHLISQIYITKAIYKDLIQQQQDSQLVKYLQFLKKNKLNKSDERIVQIAIKCLTNPVYSYIDILKDLQIPSISIKQLDKAKININMKLIIQNLIFEMRYIIECLRKQQLRFQQQLFQFQEKSLINQNSLIQTLTIMNFKQLSQEQQIQCLKFIAQSIFIYGDTNPIVKFKTQLIQIIKYSKTQKQTAMSLFKVLCIAFQKNIKLETITIEMIQNFKSDNKIIETILSIYKNNPKLTISQIFNLINYSCELPQCLHLVQIPQFINTSENGIKQKYMHIYKISQLQQFDFHDQKLGEQKLNEWIKYLMMLSQVKYQLNKLDLDFNTFIQVQQYHSIQQTVLNKRPLLRINKLFLSNNDISDIFCYNIIHYFQNLVDLDLSNNQITINGFYNLIDNLNQLQYLNLQSNQIKYQNQIEAKNNQYHLKQLKINGNDIDQNFMKWMFSHLKDIVKLKIDLIQDYQYQNFDNLKELQQLTVQQEQYANSIKICFQRDKLKKITTLKFDLSRTETNILEFKFNNLIKYLTNKSLQRLSIYKNQKTFIEKEYNIQIYSNIIYIHKLTQLDLSNRYLTPQILYLISQFCSNITKLILINADFTEKQAAIIKYFLNLREINIFGQPIVCKYQKSIRQIKSLGTRQLNRQLTMNKAKVLLQIFDDIKELDLSQTTIKQDVLQFIINSNKFYKLNLCKALQNLNTKQKRSVLKSISKAWKLKNLNLQSNHLSDQPQIQLIFGLANLTSINLNHNQLNESNLKSFIVKQKNLKILNLSSNNITDIICKSISYLINLQELNLSHNNITSQGVKEIAKLRKLKILNLYNNKIDLQGVKQIQKLECLVNLNIDKNNVGTQSLQYLGQIDTLKILEISTYNDVGEKIQINDEDQIIIEFDSKEVKEVKQKKRQKLRQIKNWLKNKFL